MATTRTAAVHTLIADSRAAGLALGADILQQLGHNRPHVVILFASPAHDYASLLQAVQQACEPEWLLGCSSAGEFGGEGCATQSISALAIHAPDMRFNARLSSGLRHQRPAVLADIAKVFTAGHHPEYAYQSALILTDALAGMADELVRDLTVLTAGNCQLFGGGAADDVRFEKTHLFLGEQMASDAVVVLEILSHKKLGLGLQHGWVPASGPWRVTETQGNRLISLNATHMVEIFQQHAQDTEQIFDRADPLPFFLHNIIGIESADGYKLRVPLHIDDSGAVVCAAEVPAGSTVHIMKASIESAVEAARLATLGALAALDGEAPAGTLVFDCVATRLRLGRAFGAELEAVAEILGSSPFAGCNTYGQIARAEGQFNGFHNCTAVVCAIPA